MATANYQVGFAAPMLAKPSIKSMWSLLVLLLRFKVAGTLFLGPLLVALVMYFSGLFWFDPVVHTGFATKFSSFFSAAATVNAGALIALAVAARLLTVSSRPVSRLAAALAFIYAVCGEVAAVAALSPSLTPDIYSQAFAITVGGGSGLLAAVLLIALRGVYVETKTREREELERLAAQGDPGAEHVLERIISQGG
jgi:hypothetical protein